MLRVNKLNIDKSYRITTPHIIIRKGENSFLSLRFQIMDKNIPLNLGGRSMSFVARDSVGVRIKERQIIVKDRNNGIIEVVLNANDIKNIGEFQLAYIIIKEWAVEHSTTDIKISVLNSVEG